MGFSRNLSESEKDAREEVDRRSGVRLAEGFIRRHLKYGVHANTAFLVEEVMRFGLVAEEVSTEKLTELLDNVERQLASKGLGLVVSPHYTASWDAFQRAYPYALVNESVEREFTRIYRQQFPYDDVMEPEKLISLASLPRAQGFLLSNGRREAEQQQLADMQASAAAGGRKIAAMLKRFYDENGDVYGANRFDKQRNQAALDIEQARLAALPTADLDAEFATFTENSRVAGLTRAQSKSEVSQQRRAYSRYEVLPDHYTPIGKTEGVQWTEKLLRLLPSTELSRLLRIYGDVQITEAIQNSASQGKS